MQNKTKAVALVAVAVPFGGLVIALGFWVYQYATDPDNAPSITDYFMSLFDRGNLIVQGQIQNAIGQVGGSPDPVAIAAGLIAQLEGFSPTAYADPPGQTTTYSIGYGHQIVSGDGFDTSSTISEADALELLQSDLANYVTCVNGAVTSALSPQQLAALYSFCYNVGCGAFSGSTLLTYVNNSDWPDAINEFYNWEIAGGVQSAALASRREKESDLFASGSPATTGADDSGDTEA